MSSPPLDDLARRLVDLAESSGPWDDPLPEIRRRAAGMTVDSAPSGSTLFRSPTAARPPRRWLHSVDITLVASVAAVVALVAGVGFLIRSAGPSSDKKVSAASPSASSAASAAGGSAAATRAAAGQPAPRASYSASCAFPAPTSAVTLRAAARVKAGTSVSVRVRLTGPAAAGVYAPLVVAVRNGRVVGRLVPNVVPPGPRVRPSAPTTASVTVTGTLRASTCAQATAQDHGPQVPRGLALAPGGYQLIAVATASGARVTSAPVTVTVVR